MTSLTSRNNPKIKQVHHLLSQRKQRDSTGLFVVEGIRHVGEAFEAHAEVEYIVYAPELLTSDFALHLVSEQSKLGLSCLAVDNETLKSLASKDNPQGIIAVVHRPRLQLESLTADTFNWGVALVAPQDPGNIGSILRTVDAVGSSGLLLLDDPTTNQFSADAYHPNSVRASMGAIFWYPVISASFSSFAEWAHDQAYHLIGTSAHAAQDYRLIKRYETPLILLMGSEREGLTENQAAICEMMIKIPMHGRVSSLNLSVATGVMLYSVLSKLESFV